MSENAKTVTFVGLAVVVALIAVISRPSQHVTTPESMVDKELFPDFTDPLAATSLEILKYDEATASVLPFKVAQVDGRWSIPSHDNYPADAKDQLANVATSLMGLRVLEVASDSPGDHGLYGVIDPNPEKLTAGETGVGTRVTMKDKDDNTLLSLIIGKPVPDQQGLRYVRRTGQDPVYTVALETDKLSTKFGDWIEKDLLKLSSWDVRDVEIRDYSIDELQGTVDMRNRLTLDYNDQGDPKWKLADDLVFQAADQKWVPNPKPMTDKQELDTAKLDAMLKALDDLKIVDVARKPEGLSEDLRNIASAEKFLNNREAVASLQERGFYPARWEGNLELFSTKGEVHTVTKDGVKYILRFGNIAGTGTNDADEKKEGDEAASGSGVNRFLFVMAEFDGSVIEKPQFEPLPEKPAEAEAAKSEEVGDKAEAKDKAADDKADASKDDSKAKVDSADEKSEAVKKYEAELARIEKENKRKQEEYDKKIADGKKKVEELSDRFADWYYVISDEVYNKIHLTRADIVKAKEAKSEGDEPGAPPMTGPANPAAALQEPLVEPGDAGAMKAPEVKAPAEPEAKPAEAKPAEAKPAEAKPTESKPAEAKPAESKPAEAKPVKEEPAATKAADKKPAGDEAAKEKSAGK